MPVVTQLSISDRFLFNFFQLFYNVKCVHINFYYVITYSMWSDLLLKYIYILVLFQAFVDEELFTVLTKKMTELLELVSSCSVFLLSWLNVVLRHL